MKRWVTLLVLAILGLFAWVLLAKGDGVRVHAHASLPAFVLKLSDPATRFRVDIGSDENGDGIPDVLMTRNEKHGFNLRRSLRSLKLRPKYRADIANWIASDSGDFLRTEIAMQEQHFEIRASAAGHNQIVRTEINHDPIALGATETGWRPTRADYLWQGEKFGLDGTGHHRLRNRVEMWKLEGMRMIFERELEANESVIRSAELRKQGRLLIKGPAKESDDWLFSEFRIATKSETVYRAGADALGVSKPGSGSWEYLALQSQPDEALRVLILAEQATGAQVLELDFASQAVASQLFWDIPGMPPIKIRDNLTLERIEGKVWIAVATIEPRNPRAPGVVPALKLRVRPPSGVSRPTSIPLEILKSDSSEDWGIFDVHSELVSDQDGDGESDVFLLVECTGYRDFAIWFLCSGATGELIEQKAQP